MELHAWLDLPEHRGKAAWLAEQLGITKGAVSLWRDDGVPMRHMARIVELTGGDVTSQAMLAHALKRKTVAADAAAQGD